MFINKLKMRSQSVLPVRHFRNYPLKIFLFGNRRQQWWSKGSFVHPVGMGGCLGSPRDGSSPNGDSSDGMGAGWHPDFA